MKKLLGPLLCALVLVLVPAPAWSEPARGPRLLAELSAGPLIGIDEPFKGISGGFLLGLVIQPFEAGIRAGAAYDSGFRAGLLRLDLELGLGSGLRAIVGGLFPLGDLALPDNSGLPRSLPVIAGTWPDRFGLAARLYALPWRLLRAEAILDAELVYTEYRLPLGTSLAEGAAARLSGAAAFAAGIEACLALRLRWTR
jgi:hypothetical protein